MASRQEPSFNPVVEAYKKDVDKAQLIESLKLTVEQRIDRLQQFVKDIEALRASRSK
ncbi:MAG TPA: hypothetical protein VFZ98_03650 [Vicinamibacterales bacterium]